MAEALFYFDRQSLGSIEMTCLNSSLAALLPLAPLLAFNYLL